MKLARMSFCSAKVFPYEFRELLCEGGFAISTNCAWQREEKVEIVAKILHVTVFPILQGRIKFWPILRKNTCAQGRLLNSVSCSRSHLWKGKTAAVINYNSKGKNFELKIPCAQKHQNEWIAHAEVDENLDRSQYQSALIWGDSLTQNPNHQSFSHFLGPFILLKVLEAKANSSDKGSAAAARKPIRPKPRFWMVFRVESHPPYPWLPSWRLSVWQEWLNA